MSFRLIVLSLSYKKPIIFRGLCTRAQAPAYSLAKLELRLRGSQAGETVKVLSKTTKINTKQQKTFCNSLILVCRNQNST